MLVASGAAWALSCSKCGGELAASPEVTGAQAAQASPAGAPVVLAFLRLEGEGTERKAVFSVRNESDKALKKLMLTLRYEDAAGKELKSLPWVQFGPDLPAAKAASELKLGAFLPPETAKVEARLNVVDFGDGSSWRSPALGRHLLNKVKPSRFDLKSVQPAPAGAVRGPRPEVLRPGMLPPTGGGPPAGRPQPGADDPAPTPTREGPGRVLPPK
jgi:hypothetical protein